MKCKAKPEYNELGDDKNFLALGSASTHLRLKAGFEVEIPAALSPLPKKLKECLKESSSPKKEVK